MQTRIKKYDFTCYFDGACAPTNPNGHMGMGAIIISEHGEPLATLSHHVPAKEGNSNNVAEYQSFGWLVKKLNEIAEAGQSVLIMGDSKLVIMQMNGEWSIKGGMYVETAIRAKVEFQNLRDKCDVLLEWIPREQNEMADSLSTACLKAKGIAEFVKPTFSKKATW